MNAFRTGTLGGFAGYGADSGLGAFGMNQEQVIDPQTGQPVIDPNTGQPMMQTSSRFSRLGAGLGMGLGGGRAGLQMVKSRMGAATPAWINAATKGAVRGERNVRDAGFSFIDPFVGGAKALVRKPIQWASGGAYAGPSWAQAGRTMAGRPIAMTPGRVAGRIAGGATIAGGGMGLAYNKLQDDISQTVDQNVGRVYNSAMPVLQNDMAGMLDQYMSSRGLTDPHTGQFNPGRGMLSGADGIFQALGLDPSRMSPIQKLMILGGAIGGGGGLIGGSPSLAGAGGLSMLGGLLPSMGGQHGGGGQTGYRPGQPAGYNGHGPNSMPPNAPSARDEWMLQQQLQGG